MTPEELRKQLSNPELLRGISLFVRKKVNDNDARDIVQCVLIEALAAVALPEEGNVKRWLLGIARHKVADHYRRNRQHLPLDGETIAASDELATESVRELARWVESELPKGGEAARTLEWMLREADGDPLEAIAKEQQLPAPAVRQRVSRLRRHLRSRWSIQLAAAALGLVVVITGYSWYEARRILPAAPEIVRGLTKQEQADELRRVALVQCRLGNYDVCVVGLDRAKVLDVGGDGNEEVLEARKRAVEAQIAAAKASNSAPVTAPSVSSRPLLPPAPSPTYLPPVKTPKQNPNLKGNERKSVPNKKATLVKPEPFDFSKSKL